ncbi:MAG: SurA N-terminal domain-containing protein [Bacteroidia bacterium]|nr:SurA N-terminal domain-containing protein [Bacteroidia bacterium]NNL33173.1 peptidylprolyl isomerase [Flavobacteriaceae bacterium]
MAILNKIRQRSLVLILVIAMALFSFVLADLFKGGGGDGKSETIVATINGVDIKRDDFMQKVENMQRQLGPQVSSTQAMNRVWDQELRKAVMDAQYEKIGISVEREQMRELIKQNLSNFEEFKNEAGLFDENKLNEFIANLKAIAPDPAFLGSSPITYDSWTTFENDIAAGGKYNTYFNMVKAGVTSTLAEGQMEYKLENDKVDIKYVQIPYASIPDSLITVTKSDIAEYVNRNLSKYQVEASRDIQYVEFKEEPSPEDGDEVKSKLVELAQNPFFSDMDEVADFVNTNSDIKFNDNFLFKDKLPVTIVDSLFPKAVGESYGPYRQDDLYVISKIVAEKQMPDSVKVRHILIPFAGGTRAAATVTKTPEEAKKTADSILRIIKSRRAKFVDLLDLSSDKVSNEKNGEIEFDYNAGMAPEFKNFSFENKKGDIDVVKTDFGYHVIEIMEQKNRQRAIKIANLALEIEPSEATVDRVFNETSKFEIAVADRDFQEVAKENNYTVKPVSNIKALEENIPGLGPQRAIVRWAFEDDTEVGDIRRFNLASGGYAVVVVSEINKKGVMSNENASITALPELKKEKKAALIRSRISASTLEEIAANQGQTVKTAVGLTMKNPTLSGAGQEPKVVGAAFGIAESTTSKPIDGNNGVYIIQTTKVTPAPELPSYQANASRLALAKANAAGTSLYNALKEAAEIEDNRKAFY